MDPIDPNDPDEQRRARARASILNPPADVLAKSRKEWQVRELRRMILDNFKFGLLVIVMGVVSIAAVVSLVRAYQSKFDADNRTAIAKTMKGYVDHYQKARRYPSPSQVVLYLQSQGQAALVGTRQATKTLGGETIVVNGDGTTLNFYNSSYGQVSVQGRKYGPTLSQYTPYAGNRHYIDPTFKIAGLIFLFLFGFLVVACSLEFRIKKRKILGAFPSTN
jgi:hypothetical protein